MCFRCLPYTFENKLHAAYYAPAIRRIFERAYKFTPVSLSEMDLAICV